MKQFFTALSHEAEKRSGDVKRISIDETLVFMQGRSAEMAAPDGALNWQKSVNDGQKLSN